MNEVSACISRGVKPSYFCHLAAFTSTALLLFFVASMKERSCACRCLLHAAACICHCSPDMLLPFASQAMLLCIPTFCCVSVLPVLLLLQTCLVTFAYMAAQWPSYLAAFPESSPCSGQGWPLGPNSLWLWLAQWNNCRRFDDNFLIVWGARQVVYTCNYLLCKMRWFPC